MPGNEQRRNSSLSTVEDQEVKIKVILLTPVHPPVGWFDCVVFVYVNIHSRTTVVNY